MTKKRLREMKKILYMLAMVAAGMLCGCSKEGEVPAGDDGVIALAPAVDRAAAPTKASLQRSSTDLRSDLFHTYVYNAGTQTLYFESDVKYSTEDIDASKHQWLFYSTDGGYKNYYWPLATSLDFFAYAPSSPEYVTVDNSTNPPTFTATLPLTNTGENKHQENIKEFMYAYTSGRQQSSGAVPLEFQHPFAAVRFVVSQSHRDLTVNSISINGIYYKGTSGTDGIWTDLSEGDLELTIDKIIPGDVNFGGELCGPYLVLPQINSGADSNKKEVVIQFHWDGEPDSNWVPVDTGAKIYKLSGSITNDWEASKVYTYTLDLGNSREEILFKISVDEWEFVYEHEFEIE